MSVALCGAQLFVLGMRIDEFGHEPAAGNHLAALPANVVEGGAHEPLPKSLAPQRRVDHGVWEDHAVASGPVVGKPNHSSVEGDLVPAALARVGHLDRRVLKV